MEIIFKAWPEKEGGYSAHAQVEGEDLFTQGETLDELNANVLEVIQLFIEGKGTNGNGSTSIRYTLQFSGKFSVPA